MIGRFFTVKTDVFVGCFFCAVFIPGHMLGWGVEWSFVVVLCGASILAALVFNIPHNIGNWKTSSILYACMLLEVCYLASFLSGQLMFSFETGIRDIVELARFFVWALFFILVTTVSSPGSQRWFEIILKSSIVFSGFVFFCYRVHVPVFSWFFNSFLYADTKTNVTGWERVRFSVPFENPNFFAFYLLMVLSYFLFFSSGRYRVPFSCATFILIFLTGSRSGWICASLIVFVWGVLSVSDAALSRRTGNILAVSVFAIIVGVVGYVNLDQIASSGRVQVTLRALLGDGLTTESNLAARIDMTINTIEYIKKSLILGLGTAKYATMDVVDNQAAKWVLHGGLISVITILGMLGAAAWYHYRGCRTRQHRYGVVAFWLSMGLMLQTGAFLDNYRLGFIFCCFVAMVSLVTRDVGGDFWKPQKKYRFRFV